MFAGGWTLPEAEAICSDTAEADLPPLPGREMIGVRVPGVRPDDVLDLLTHLVDKSLVVMEEQEGEGRYRFLETIRQYARDKLLESDEGAALRDRHLKWFLDLAEQGEPELHGPDQAMWLDRLEVEHDNLRAALEWSLGSGEVEAGLRLTGALWQFWHMQGYFSEGREWLKGMLARSSSASASARAKALHMAGLLAEHQGDYSRATALLEESLALFRELGDEYRWNIAGGLSSLGQVTMIQGDYGRATTLCEEALALSQEAGDKGIIAFSLLILGLVALQQGDYRRAAALCEESLVLHPKPWNEQGTSYLLSHLSLVVLHQGDHDRAAKLCEEALALAREVGNKEAIVKSLSILGIAARVQSDHGRAIELLKESLSLSWEIGDRLDIAWCLEGLSEVAVAQGQQERAARLFGAAEALREDIGAPLPPSERPDYDRSVAAARAGLGEEAFVAAWAEGRKMTVEKAIQLAVGGGQ